MSDSEDDALDILAGLDIGSDDDDDLLGGFDMASDDGIPSDDDADIGAEDDRAEPAPAASSPAPAAGGEVKPSVSDVLARMRAQREEARRKMAETIERTAVSVHPCIDELPCRRSPRCAAALPHSAAPVSWVSFARAW